MWHREYGSFPKAATKRSLKGTDVTRVKSYVHLPFSLHHDELHIISFISFRLQPLCSADMNKNTERFQSGDDFIHWCYMSDNSCIPLLCSVSFSNISQAESFIRYPHTKSSASSSER